jgi:hypothetical protein
MRKIIGFMTKPRSIVLAIITMMLALAGATVAYAVPHGAPSASARPTANLAAISKWCGVIHVALHGTKAPTITCLSRTRPAIPAHHRAGVNAVPTTSQIDCNNSAANMIVGTSTGSICFTGSGYLGVNPNLNYVEALAAHSNSWARIYVNGPGTYFNIVGTGAIAYLLPPSGFQNIKLTQVCDGCGYVDVTGYHLP